MFPSGPVVTAPSVETVPTVGYSTTVFGSEGENRAIEWLLVSQSAPSGPVVMYCPPPVNPVTAPAGVIRPIPVAPPVNQSAPSGPAAMAVCPPPTGNSVTAPAGVIRPILLALLSVNHKLPSGPAAMAKGLLTAVGIGNSVMVCAPANVARPMSRRAIQAGLLLSNSIRRPSFRLMEASS